MKTSLAALIALGAQFGAEPAAVPAPKSAPVVVAQGFAAPQVQSHTSSRGQNPHFPVPNDQIVAAARGLGQSMWRFAGYECESNPGGERVFCDFYFSRLKGYEQFRVQLRPAAS